MQQILVGGAWVSAGEGASLDVVNPATLEPLGTVPDCSAEDVGRAVAAARAALPAWQALSQAQRAALLREVSERLLERLRELATHLTRESGKPLCESIDCLTAVAALFQAGAVMAGRDADQHAPAGVVAAITPFNFPLLFMASAVSSALGAGSTLVCKPAQQNPLACLSLARCFDGLPAGVVNVITGGADTGAALARHPDITSVNFTGSAEVGRRIAAEAKSPHRHIALESGGIGAQIVCRDADLDIAVPAIAWARLFNGGQVCGAGKHVYVERSIAADFVERMHQCIGFLDVDDPIKRTTDLGPLISLAAAHRVEDQVGRALRDGAKLILGGRRFRPSGLPGHFFQPTILASVPAGSVPLREEILGPIVTISPVTDLPEAIGLSAAGAAGPICIYTRDPQSAAGLLNNAELADIRVNDPLAGASGPYGGLHHAQIRRLLGADASAPVAARVERKPWWFPYQARAIPEAR
jgi:acyl-CoA reductase-like NAD-dependent aldehyde dehydrogenase